MEYHVQEGMGTIKNTMMVDETGSNEEEGNKSASTCIFEELKLGLERTSTIKEVKNGAALDTGCTSSVPGDPWLTE